MLNPTSLFLACLLTVAANPSFVSAIPLPPAPHRSPLSFLRHRSVRPARRHPILRIVDDEISREPVSWTSTFSDESILADSIFDDEIQASLDLELGAIHQPHNILKRSLPANSAQPVKKTKRSGDAHARSLDKRYSSRWLRGQAERKRRKAQEATASASSTAVWSKVPTATPTTTSSTSTETATATSEATSAAPPTPTSLDGTHTGDGTWFAPGLGACGTVATDDSPIVAVSHLLYDSYPGATVNPNLNPICGKRIRATYAGNTVEVVVQDRCVGCAWGDLDFSPAMFSKLADVNIGRLHGVEWTFI
ncbi:RlpA-like double-psi beta-barrel domain-containing protein [Sporobolomyces koalae]|uniref:RlpA-like double-psi beta-barrel domain-containing protein n=1 Tax=Sporobolomyces koalae TaxID=500713 RepID=UPI00316F4A30